MFSKAPLQVRVSLRHAAGDDFIGQASAGCTHHSTSIKCKIENLATGAAALLSSSLFMLMLRHGLKESSVMVWGPHAILITAFQILCVHHIRLINVVMVR